MMGPIVIQAVAIRKASVGIESRRTLTPGYCAAAWIACTLLTMRRMITESGRNSAKSYSMTAKNQSFQ